MVVVILVGVVGNDVVVDLIDCVVFVNVVNAFVFISGVVMVVCDAVVDLDTDSTVMFCVLLIVEVYIAVSWSPCGGTGVVIVIAGCDTVMIEVVMDKGVVNGSGDVFDPCGVAIPGCNNEK